MKDAKIQQAYEAAKARYAEIGVDTDAVLNRSPKYPCRCTAGRRTT